MLYPEEMLYEEMSFISYYYHWSAREVEALDHRSRRRWCEQISAIHEKQDLSSGQEKSILDGRSI